MPAGAAPPGCCQDRVQGIEMLSEARCGKNHGSQPSAAPTCSAPVPAPRSVRSWPISLMYSIGHLASISARTRRLPIRDIFISAQNDFSCMRRRSGTGSGGREQRGSFWEPLRGASSGEAGAVSMLLAQPPPEVSWRWPVTAATRRCGQPGPPSRVLLARGDTGRRRGACSAFRSGTPLRQLGLSLIGNQCAVSPGGQEHPGRLPSGARL
jgi:hypothetical protein